MNLMKDQLDEAVANQNFLSAQEIKSKMDQLEEEQIMLEGQLAAAKTAGMAPPAKPAAVGTPVASNPAAGQIDDSGPDPDNPAVTLKCLRLIVSTLQVSSAATVIKCIGITNYSLLGPCHNQAKRHPPDLVGGVHYNLCPVGDSGHQKGGHPGSVLLLS